jgi:hypothetical protein
LIPGGIYVWDGTRWNDIYVATKYVDITVDVPDEDGNSTGKKTLRFLTYNLGANPNMTVKEQMAYVSTMTKPEEDITVFGGLFQWGRKDAEHSLRCDKDDVPGSFIETPYPSADYDPSTSHVFVWGVNDWITPQKGDLWGNGGGASGQEDTNYTGNQNVNNPCPSGYRVPTEYEWALLGHDAGGSDNFWDDYLNTSDHSTSSGLGFIPDGNPGIVWVPVSEGNASTSWKPGATCGYALYTFGEWDGAALGYKTGNDPLTDADAPEPLLFLPAGGDRYYYDGGVRYTGIYGYYWSSVVYGPDSYSMYFVSSNVYADYNNSRALGMSVRCVSEF